MPELLARTGILWAISGPKIQLTWFSPGTQEVIAQKKRKE